MKKRLPDTTGQKFGIITVLYNLPREKGEPLSVHCIDDNGKEADIRVSNLLSGQTKSCRGKKRKGLRRRKLPNVDGQKFEKLTVLYELSTPKSGVIFVHVRCDCGNELNVRIVDLLRGWTTSCGLCSKKKCDTKTELKMEEELKRFGIPYVKQFKVGGYTTDFRILNTNIIIEADGCHWHNCITCGNGNDFPGKIEEDQRRHDFIESLGYTVIHFWEHEINENPLACFKRIPLISFC